MYERLDVLLAVVIAAALGYALYRMCKFDKHVDDVKGDGSFVPPIFPRATERQEFRRRQRRQSRYGSIVVVIFFLLVYAGLRLSGTIGSPM
jgi:hypothetical protein